MPVSMKMEFGHWLVLAATAVIVAAASWVGWSLAEWLWLQPRRLERKLRAQGLRGSRYRLPFGDIKNIGNLVGEARRKPLPLSHRIVDRVDPYSTRIVDTYGGKNKAAFFWFGPYPRVIIMDPELVKGILSTKFGHFEKLKPTPIARQLFLGVASCEGEKWVKHRRIINPAFHTEKLKIMMPAFSACCDELISQWEDLADNAGVFELNVWSEFLKLSGDVISRAAFGSSYKEGRRIFELLGEQVELVMQAARNLYIPGFRFLPTQKNKRRNQNHEEIVALLKIMIEQRECLIKNGNAVPNDLLSLLMESNQRYAQEGDHLQDFSLTTEDMIEECKLFYAAGHETTSVLLTWTMIVLSMHPNWQNLAREEVLRVFGHDKPTFEGLSRLKILTTILYEVLRLYPPGVTLLRQTYKEVKLGEFTFPPEVQLVLPILLLHHSKEFWGEDAEEFNPDRFSEGVSNATKNQLIFFPFGWGPRICIGQSFALIEAKMVLARILQRFSAELSPSYTHAPHTILTLRPQHGAQVILHKLPLL
ncbi:cytochrome P450 CYP72A219-like [Phalaenopsis equestris]|uniref:cytochrome P450 CYP72A219-like n=1 Tax=Phalaenopsis equestris TaxID=78828 RepID=UPI0009E4F744|nr:cytochrome P450 CYP72A219-like [Phalaenopsis equestris]